MKVWMLVTSSILVGAVGAFPLISLAQPTADVCPTGQVVQGVDFARRSLICAPAPGASALHMVDADGQLVGMFSDANILVRKFNNEWFRFPVLATGFDANNSVTLFYPSDNCTGPAFVLLGTALGQVFPYFVTYVGETASATFYVPQPGTDTTTTTLSSRRVLTLANPSGSGTCSAVAPFQSGARIATPVNVTTTLPWRLTE
jgi:hypothetical protein